MLSTNHSSHNCELLERAKRAYKSADYSLAESTFTALISRHSSLNAADSASIQFVVLLLDYRAACRYHLHLTSTLMIKDNHSSDINRKRLKQMNWLALAMEDAKLMIQLGPNLCRGYLRLAKLLLDGEDKLVDALDVIERGIENYSRASCKLGRLLYEMRNKIKDRINNSIVSEVNVD